MKRPGRKLLKKRRLPFTHEVSKGCGQRERKVETSYIWSIIRLIAIRLSSLFLYILKGQPASKVLVVALTLHTSKTSSLNWSGSFKIVSIFRVKSPMSIGCVQEELIK